MQVRILTNNWTVCERKCVYPKMTVFLDFGPVPKLVVTT